MKTVNVLLMAIAIALVSCNKEGKMQEDPWKGIQNDPHATAVTGAAVDVAVFSATLYGWSNKKEETGVSIPYGIEYSSTDLTADAISLMASEKDHNNKYCCQATGLTSNTLYYYRAFTLYNGVREYGEVKTFTTKSPDGILTTKSASDVYYTIATINGFLNLESVEPYTKRVSFICGNDNSLSRYYKREAWLNGDGTFNYTLSDLEPSTTYYYRSCAVVNGEELLGEIKSFTTKTPAAAPAGSVDLWTFVKKEDGSQYVVYWATCNLGTSNPEDYGDYYAWGETETKSAYSWSTYKFGTSYLGPFSKYNTESSYGTVDNKTVLDPEDDVAHVKLGGKWRLPTVVEWNGLTSTKHLWEWTNLNGVNGYKVTGPNDKSIFLPAAGIRRGTDLDNVGSYGIYWSSSLFPGRPIQACCVDFDSYGLSSRLSLRSDGLSVRPVSE